MSLADYRSTRHEAFPDLKAVEREVYPDWRAICREARIEVAPYEPEPGPTMSELAKRLLKKRRH